jgi:hypothetical protein
VADHVNEPTAPITDPTLRVLRYFDPRVVVPCTGAKAPPLADIPFAVGRQLRLEGFVVPTARPSEHFHGLFRLEELIYGPQGNIGHVRPQWVVEWAHSNVTPHGPLHGSNPGKWRIVTDHANIWLQKPGIWRVTLNLITLESDQVFTRYCVFRTE